MYSIPLYSNVFSLAWNFRPLQSTRCVNEYDSAQVEIRKEEERMRDATRPRWMIYRSLARGLSGAHKLHTSLETEQNACTTAETRNAVTVSPEIVVRIRADPAKEVSRHKHACTSIHIHTHIHIYINTHKRTMHAPLRCTLAARKQITRVTVAA